MRKKDKEKDEEKKEFWPVTAAVQLFFLAIIVAIFPWAISPFSLMSVWVPPNGLPTWEPTVWGVDCWPVLAWGVGATLVFQILSGVRRNKEQLDNAEEHYAAGALISVWAGVAEEIAFRWIFFLYGMIGIKVANFLFFGFLGFGIAEHIYLYIVGPIANFFTLGLMKGWLFHPAHWAIGAALLAANAKFRDGHKYQGPFGIINSWYIGMFFFWVMLSYGLLAAIFIHFVYDFLIFTVVYVLTLGRKVTS